MQSSHYLPRTLPEPILGLAALALDLRWSWNHGADDLWRSVDPELWDATANPWSILEAVADDRLRELADDSQFLARLESQLAERDAHCDSPGWFAAVHGKEFRGSIAYFSMEFGFGDALPIFAGGLGVLAADHLKTACDLDVPVIAVGLLYQQGYFRQSVDARGEQIEFYPYSDPTTLPLVPLRDKDGKWVRVVVELPGRDLRLRAWRAAVGRRELLLLDSDDLLNTPGDRGITSELYGGGSEMRLQQEIVLGIGGWRLLKQLGFDCPVCHLNEGHAAFAILERAHHFVPCFYERDEHGLPRAWIDRMRESMAQLTTRFSSNRMLREYVEQYYLPLAAAVRGRDAAAAIRLEKWHARLKANWGNIHFGNVTVGSTRKSHHFDVQVYLQSFPPNRSAWNCMPMHPVIEAVSGTFSNGAHR